MFNPCFVNRRCATEIFSSFKDLDIAVLIAAQQRVYVATEPATSGRWFVCMDVVIKAWFYGNGQRQYLTDLDNHLSKVVEKRCEEQLLDKNKVDEAGETIAEVIATTAEYNFTVQETKTRSGRAPKNNDCNYYDNERHGGNILTTAGTRAPPSWTWQR